MQYWNILGRASAVHYQKAVLDIWYDTFNNCGLYASFCVHGDVLLPHSINKMVYDLEEQTGKQFVFKPGKVYVFTRVE